MPEPADHTNHHVRLVVEVDVDQHPAWRDGLETFAGVVAELLAEHSWSEGQSTCTGCSWAPSAVELEEQRRQHCEHQASLLPVMDVYPRVQSDLALALLDVVADRGTLDQQERTAILAAHAGGWGFARIAALLGSSIERVRRIHNTAAQVPIAPAVHSFDGPASDRGAA